VGIQRSTSIPNQSVKNESNLMEYKGTKGTIKAKNAEKEANTRKTDFMLLQETKCDGETMGKIAHKIWI
jgi:hypothetical protein